MQGQVHSEKYILHCTLTSGGNHAITVNPLAPEAQNSDQYVVDLHKCLGLHKKEAELLLAAMISSTEHCKVPASPYQREA